MFLLRVCAFYSSPFSKTSNAMQGSSLLFSDRIKCFERILDAYKDNGVHDGVVVSVSRNKGPGFAPREDYRGRIMCNFRFYSMYLVIDDQQSRDVLNVVL